MESDGMQVWGFDHMGGKVQLVYHSDPIILSEVEYDGKIRN